MDMMEQLSRIGIVPVIAINDAADAVPLAQALIDGGLPCAEVSTISWLRAVSVSATYTVRFILTVPTSNRSRQ